jgi:hypothetical protein
MACPLLKYGIYVEALAIVGSKLLKDNLVLSWHHKMCLDRNILSL